IKNPANSPLTITATVQDESLAYQLDQANDFFVPAQNPNDNKQGRGEKFIQGTKNLPGQVYWYFMYPDGRFFEYRSSLDASIYLGTLPTGYYQNLAALVDAPAPVIQPIALTVDVTGQDLIIRQLTPGWLGFLPISVSVSDPYYSTSRAFMLEIF